MKKIFWGIALTILLTFTLTGGVWADDAKPSGTSVDDIKSMLGLSIYLQGGYTYNFKNPDSQENGLRVFDHKANSFTVDLAELVFNRDATVGGVGYRLKLSAGETAKFIHASGLGDSNDSFDVTEAYIDYVAPLGKGLKLQFGKFVTFAGAEVIEARDNMNYSRGLLFNYAIPFTHTGLLVGYPFSDKVNANFYVVNGWDNFNDEGNSKTLGLNVNITPVEQLSLAVNFLNGREVGGATGGDTNRFLSDTVITVNPAKNLTFVVNTDYATQSAAAPDGSDAKWYGVAAYVKYGFSDLFSTAVRGEYFKDPDGVRTGMVQTVKEVTFTPEFNVAKNLIVRPEYRHDWSNKDAFDSQHGTFDKKSQDTVALGVMYTW
jgi:Putative beta-barrel porin-2, OmpL-like. bbp2